jgi:hypothetical protein
MPSIHFAELRRRIPIGRVLELVGFRPVRHSGAELRGPQLFIRGEYRKERISLFPLRRSRQRA